MSENTQMAARPIRTMVCCCAGGTTATCTYRNGGSACATAFPKCAGRDGGIPIRYGDRQAECDRPSGLAHKNPGGIENPPPPESGGPPSADLGPGVPATVDVRECAARSIQPRSRDILATSGTASSPIRTGKAEPLALPACALLITALDDRLHVPLHGICQTLPGLIARIAAADRIKEVLQQPGMHNHQGNEVKTKVNAAAVESSGVILTARTSSSRSCMRSDATARSSSTVTA